MKLSRTARGALALTTALVAAPALAEVTPADVLANQQAYVDAWGATFSATLNGDTVTGVQISAVLPMGLGGFEITAPDYTMTQNGDGTVSINYPSPMEIGVSGFIQDAGTGSATLVFTHDGYDLTASGEPGNITYVSDVTTMGMSLGDWAADGIPDGAVDVLMDVTIDGFNSTMTITEGNLITSTIDSTVGTSVAHVEITTPDGIVAVSDQTTLTTKAQGTIALPVGGSDIMNLSEALRNGLSIDLTSVAEGSSSQTIGSLNGEVVSEETQTMGMQDFTFTFDESGIGMVGSAEAFAMSILDPSVMPMPIGFGLENLSMDVQLPVNANAEPQPFKMAMALEGLTIADDLWAMFDPAGNLPRDPGTIAFDVTGSGSLGTDLLNIATLMTMSGPPPITVDQVSVNRLEIAAVGARATAEGAVTLDWKDMMTWGGIPAPDGEVTITVEGANGLMGRLVDMGLLAEEDIMGAMMMMGMFAQSIGEDTLQSTIEVTADGHLFANGMQLQ